MDANAIYLRRRSKVLLPDAEGETPLSDGILAAFSANVEALGYGLSPALLDACRGLSRAQLVALHESLIPTLQQRRGAHRVHRPFYPDFPEQVMAQGDAQLYLNALIHYWTDGQARPAGSRRRRVPPLDQTPPTRLDPGTTAEFEGLFAQIAAANVALSEQDQSDLQWFVAHYGEKIVALVPERIPQKENAAFVAGLLLRRTAPEPARAAIGRFCRTATDVLRLAVALSDGDLSLAEAAKLRTFSRPERVLLLELLERTGAPAEEMLRWKRRWIRLGEKLHPGEYRNRFPGAARAFDILRHDTPVPTFHSAIERAVGHRDVYGALARLATRPGELARRLDHLLRLDVDAAGSVLGAFAEVADRIATPVLLQVRHHFAHRAEPAALRVFFPKGSLAKAHAATEPLPPLPGDVCNRLAGICTDALLTRFAALAPLGSVYVDPALRDYPVPFALRSASRALRTLVRGSRLPLPDTDTLRFFVWWTNGAARTDIDLSAALFDTAFGYRGVLSYYNLKEFGGCHSGDIVDAPRGASEFIDVSRRKLRAAGIRYVAMTIQCYTDQTFVELPECFAGWMARGEPGSGEAFEPKTVQDRLDVSAASRVALPLLIDVEAGTLIWCDMALRSNPRWVNNVQGNLGGIALTLRSLMELRRPDQYDLLSLHARARGEQVDDPAQADTVFSVAAGTPFRLDELAANYLA